MRKGPAALISFVAISAMLGCGSGTATQPGVVGTPIDSVKVALTDLTSGAYLGFPGGLYPNGSDVEPSPHAAEGARRAALIKPLDANGNPSASGKIVLVSIGMSNTSQEFCAANGTTSCFPETFMGVSASDNAVNHSSLVIVNGAQGGEDASDWNSPTAPTFNVVRDQRLAQLGVREKQVQIVWLKEADANPTVSLPDAAADAYVLERRLGDIVRALRVRYPNLRQVFLGTRTYGGYSTGRLNPEPFAYESGFAVKWLIQAQIDQAQSGRVVDVRAGDLDYGAVAPWIAWGPYAWANGTVARSDGLTWIRDDFGPDGTHPSALGRAKVGTLLLSFFKTSTFTRCWFLAGRSC
ncbi:MAG: hypothetical protein ABIQ55_08075 [Gemmatimonadaceae bacterium]